MHRSIPHPIGPDHGGTVSIDTTPTVPVDRLGRLLGYLDPAPEAVPARAVVLAFDLEVPLLE